jgi:L-threonylcarbamoyladenylate synthase
LTLEQLSVAWGEKVLLEGDMRTKAVSAPKASGTLAAHYAPVAKLFLMDKHEIEKKLVQSKKRSSIAIWSRAPVKTQSQGRLDKKTAIHWQQIPSNPTQCAQMLFAQLRAFDALGAEQIWVESPPSDSAWEGVHDRLRRAETADR